MKYISIEGIVSSAIVAIAVALITFVYSKYKKSLSSNKRVIKTIIDEIDKYLGEGNRISVKRDYISYVNIYLNTLKSMNRQMIFYIYLIVIMLISTVSMDIFFLKNWVIHIFSVLILLCLIWAIHKQDLLYDHINSVEMKLMSKFAELIPDFNK